MSSLEGSGGPPSLADYLHVTGLVLQRHEHSPSTVGNAAAHGRTASGRIRTARSTREPIAPQLAVSFEVDWNSTQVPNALRDVPNSVRKACSN